MKPTTLKQALKDKLTKKEFGNLVTSYDIIGDISIIEILKLTFSTRIDFDYNPESVIEKIIEKAIKLGKKK